MLLHNLIHIGCPGILLAMIDKPSHKHLQASYIIACLKAEIKTSDAIKHRKYNAFIRSDRSTRYMLLGVKVLSWKQWKPC